jgi:uncharacterized protein (TIGR02246 family)
MSTLAIRFLPSVLVLFVGCNSSDTLTPDTALGQPSAASERIGAIPGDPSAIEAIIDALTVAWNTKDATAYAAPFANDADFVNPVGGIVTGRDAFRAVHVGLFDGPFKGSTQTLVVRRMVFLTGTIAVVDLDSTLTGYAFLPPTGLVESSPGVISTRVSWVLVKRAGTWEIIKQQMTLIPPPPSL